MTWARVSRLVHRSASLKHSLEARAVRRFTGTRQWSQAFALVTWMTDCSLITRLILTL